MSKMKPFYPVNSIPQTSILLASSRGVLRQPTRMAGVVTMVDNGKGEVGYLIIIIIIIIIIIAISIIIMVVITPRWEFSLWTTSCMRATKRRMTPWRPFPVLSTIK